MRRKISLILTLAAWLVATGSQWDALQTFAWGRMIVENSREMTVAQAVTKTFSAETMCSICEVVAEAKQEESRRSGVPDAKVPGKIPLVCAPPALVVAAPVTACVGLMGPAATPTSADRSPPPVRPPRTLV